MTKFLQSSITRYVLFMSIALLLGVLINNLLSYELGREINFDNMTFLLIVYGVLALIVGCVVYLVSKLISPYAYKNEIYVAAATFGLVASLFIFPFHQYRGVHIVIILWFGLFLSAVDRMVVARLARPGRQV